jgi:3-methyl-2-oxobutanoate hydroxymethyltransferase
MTIFSLFHFPLTVLVGDSLAQVVLGYDSTTRLTLPEMLHHVKAVARGCKTPLLTADMPFGSYHGSIDNSVFNAIKMIQEGGAESLKIEGGEEIVPLVSKLTRIGIPVMAHIGLLPQRHTSFSGYKVQGKSAQDAQQLLRSAYALQDAGAHSIVLEAIPAPLGVYITSKLNIPTIGIGAGPQTDGQVLVMSDVLGTWHSKAKFVRRFADLRVALNEGVVGYVEAVRSRTFPSDDESYSIPDEEWRRFLELEGAGLQEMNH